MKNQTGSKGFTFVSLAIMNIVAVVSLRGLPAEAEYGLGSVFYYIFAAIVFLIPVALVAAELASSYPQKGGVYRWVGEAFGPRLGFLSVWLLWAQNTIWYPTVLTFAAVSLAFSISNQSLAGNKTYVLLISLAIYWGATLLNFKGFKRGATVSKVGGIIGTIIPVALLILFGSIWLILGNPIQMNLSPSTFIPDFSNINNLVLATSIFLFFAGMEMSAVHVKEIDNPTVNYPKAIIISSIATLVIFIFGTLALGFVIPQDKINLTQSLFIAFNTYLTAYHLEFLGPVIAFMLGIGVLAGVSTWIAGPSKGLLAVGNSGYLPKFLQKTNKNGVQVNILIVQGIIVTILALLFILLPSVQSVYQILSQLTVILYLMMYMLMFAAAIYLRVTRPNIERPFKVPGGKVGIYILATVGFIGSLAAYFLSFLAPSQIAIGSTTLWYTILIVGNLIFVAVPFIIYHFRKPSWKSEDSENNLEPFSWEINKGV